jgi:hypothetical protein
MEANPAEGPQAKDGQPNHGAESLPVPTRTASSANPCAPRDTRLMSRFPQGGHPRASSRPL